MNYLRNHCWCSDSNWGGNYDCQIIVGLNCYEDEYKEDWENLTIKVPTKKTITSMSFPTVEIDTYYIALKPEVLQWLENNITDFQGNKGWCVGSNTYDENNHISYSVFFQRRKDAMKFIKTWSKWRKPLFYCQYFTDIRKELNTETGKYTPIN